MIYFHLLRRLHFFSTILLLCLTAWALPAAAQKATAPKPACLDALAEPSAQQISAARAAVGLFEVQDEASQLVALQVDCLVVIPPLSLDRLSPSPAKKYSISALDQAENLWPSDPS